MLSCHNAVDELAIGVAHTLSRDPTIVSQIPVVLPPAILIYSY